MNEGNAEPVTPKILQRGISIRDLSVQAGNKSLLVNAEADFKAGQITLIVGPSGVGKSILLKLISGILDRSESAIEHSGDIRINGQPTQPGKVGVVFQSFALFDELSAESNVQLARSFGGEHANKMS
ncbi:MAG: ATP-binding cassette domain-containing protein, partial [Planctomycetota bacterium]